MRTTTKHIASDPSEQPFDERMRTFLRDSLGAGVTRRCLGRAALGLGAALTLTPRALIAAPAPSTHHSSARQQEPTTFSYGLEGDASSLDPAYAYDSTSLPPVCQITEGLMAFDANNELQPLLAERFEHPDSLTYVYTIRQGVPFHDGTMLTVDDVVASIERVRDPETASPMAWMYEPVDAVTMRDDHTVIVTLKAPSPLFQYVPAVSAGHVVPRAAVAARGDDFARNPIGTGPFMFVRWDAGSEIELQRNPTYWQSGKPVFERLLFKVIPNGTTRSTALKTGELQAVTVIPPEQIPLVRSFAHIEVQEEIGFAVGRIVMRQDRPPFDDRRIREAVSLAIDVDAIMTGIIKEAGVRAIRTAVPPNMPGSATARLQPVPYDPTRAKQLLAESGFPNGFATTLTVAPFEAWVTTSVYVQQALSDLGIEVEIVEEPWENVISIYTSGDYEGMIFHGWLADFPDPSGMLLPLFHSRNVPPQPNIGYYRNATVDELLDASEVEPDAERRLALLIEAQELIADHFGEVWLEHTKAYWFMDRGVSGFTLSPMWAWQAFARDLAPR